MPIFKIKHKFIVQSKNVTKSDLPSPRAQDTKSNREIRTRMKICFAPHFLSRAGVMSSLSNIAWSSPHSYSLHSLIQDLYDLHWRVKRTEPSDKSIMSPCLHKIFKEFIKSRDSWKKINRKSYSLTWFHHIMPILNIIILNIYTLN